MPSWHVINRKFNNTVKIGQKMAGNVGRVMTKTAGVADKILGAVDNATGGAASMIPGFSTAKGVVSAAKHLGAGLTGVGAAGSSLDGALHSLTSAYKNYKDAGTAHDPAPGAEGVQTAADPDA